MDEHSAKVQQDEEEGEKRKERVERDRGGIHHGVPLQETHHRTPEMKAGGHGDQSGKANREGAKSSRKA
jgi:hypothetical protein